MQRLKSKKAIERGGKFEWLTWLIHAECISAFQGCPPVAWQLAGERCRLAIQVSSNPRVVGAALFQGRQAWGIKGGGQGFDGRPSLILPGFQKIRPLVRSLLVLVFSCLPFKSLAPIRWCLQKREKGGNNLSIVDIGDPARPPPKVTVNGQPMTGIFLNLKPPSCPPFPHQHGCALLGASPPSFLPSDRQVGGF